MQLSMEEKAELAEVYERAAEYLEEYGWFGSGPNCNIDLHNAACMAIAIDKSAKGKSALACEFVQEALELEGHTPAGAIFRWNDDPDRKADEVINTFHALANKLR